MNPSIWNQGTTLIPNVFESFGVNVQLFPYLARGDGVTDDTAALEAAINSGATLILLPTPTVFYRTTRPIKIPSGVKLQGAHTRIGFVGQTYQTRSCIRKTTNTTVNIKRFDSPASVARDCVFYVDPAYTGSFYPQKVSIDAISIVGDGPSLIDYAVYFEQGSDLVWTDSDVAGIKHALYARNIWSSRFDGVQAMARFTIEVAATSLSFNQCLTGYSPDGWDGFYLTGVSYSVLNACASDNTTGSAYTLAGCWGLTINGSGCEGPNNPTPNEGQAFNFLGGNHAVVITGFFGLMSNVARPNISTTNGDSITFIGAKFDAGNPALTSDMYVSNYSVLTFEDTFFKNGTKNTPTITFPGANASEVGVYYNGEFAKFTATQSLVDSFVKSTWTPAVTFGGASVGVTYATRSGTHAIRGKICTAYAEITLSSKGSSVGAATITGLPIAADVNSNGVAICLTQANITKRFHGQIAGNGTEIVLLTEDVTTVAMTNVEFANNSTFRLAITYQVN